MLEAGSEHALPLGPVLAQLPAACVCLPPVTAQPAFSLPQIFDLETNYFQISSAMGNAVRGYEGFLGGSKKSAAAPVQPEERLFSWSSLTGQLGGAHAE